MNKVYERINWANGEVGNTPLNESNLNKMDSALNEIDDRVVEQASTKANKEDLNPLVKEISIDETTGKMSVAKASGEAEQLDLPTGGSGTDLIDLTYEDYMAKKDEYDSDGKAYFVADYPYENGKAEETYFDDAVAQLGADNVQGAIEAVKTKCDRYGSRFANIYASFNVAYIATNANKTVTIKFKSSSSFAFFFGRNASNNVLCASIAYNEVKNLGTSGTYTASDGTITMALNNYAMGFLLFIGVESITYS